MAGTLTITVHGFDMPGTDAHVGVQREREVIELVPADASEAEWTFDVTTKPLDDGSTDFGGPFVHGRRGERFLYLSWGTVGANGEFEMFRRAKLMFADCRDEVLAEALRRGNLVCRVRMTDAHGNPRCARVREPDATWSVR